MDIAVIVGNPRTNSRTLDAASAVAELIARSTTGSVTTVVDLARYQDRMFRHDDAELDSITAAVLSSDLVVMASPTYKASFTGLLKAFLDRLDHRALSGMTAVPVMTGGSQTHALAPDMQLRPVLLELGASLPTSALYLDMSDPESIESQITSWLERNAVVLGRLSMPPKG